MPGTTTATRYDCGHVGEAEVVQESAGVVPVDLAWYGLSLVHIHQNASEAVTTLKKKHRIATMSPYVLIPCQPEYTWIAENPMAQGYALARTGAQSCGPAGARNRVGVSL
jgi:hypothetical protein